MDCSEYEKRKKAERKRIKFWLNPACITFIVFLILAIITIIIEAVSLKVWQTPLIQLSLWLIIGTLILFGIGFLWTNEMFISSWTLAFSPLISIFPTIVFLGYRKVKLDGTLHGDDLKIIA
jgi:hypothetical protein